MRIGHVASKSIPIAVTALTLVVAAACGGASAPPDQKASVSEVPQTAAVRSPEAAPSATAAPAPSPPAASTGPLALVATNLLFDKKQLSATAGSVTIDLDNQDKGVPHNVHVFNGKDATGASLEATTIEAGPVKQSLKLDLVKGQYFYQCDVHPTTMLGTIAVG